MSDDVQVWIKTFAPLRHMRMGLLENCIASAVSAFGAENVGIVNNGAHDVEAVAAVAVEHGMQGLLVTHHGESSPGHGAQYALVTARADLSVRRRGTKIMALSDDDMVWKADAADRLREIWAHAPDDLIICSGLLEPDYPWATVRSAIDCGRQRILIRDNAPGCAWTFRAEHVAMVHDQVETGFGFDHKACVKLIEKGYTVAQADLAEHAGWGYSTHGNEAIDAPSVRPLDRKKWGL